MIEVRVQELAPGAEVAQDVVVGKQVLVPSGTRLSTTMIASLIKRGVETVAIRAGEEPGQSTGSDDSTRTMVYARDALAGEALSSRGTETLNKALAKLEAQFAPYGDDPVMSGLKGSAVRYWVQRSKQIDTEIRDRKTAILTSKDAR